MDRAAETDKPLKKTIRERKRDRFVKFAEKPTGESFKIMSNIRRRVSGPSGAYGLGSSHDNL